MSKHPSDAFLPSGAIDSPRKVPGRLDSMISPRSQVPRSVPDYVPSPHSGTGSPSPNTFLQSRSPSQHPNGPPISPPKTRSASADDNSAGLVEDWRIYTQKLRSQSEGERAHMAADRARMEEVMAEERALWDRERDILKARIAELEAELQKRKASGSPGISPPRQRPNPNPISFTSPGSNAVSVTGSLDGSRGVPQESGRNADGTPFYAPAARNPSRTFDASELGEFRVDSMTAPRESAIRVTSKELTSSDFGVRSPPSAHSLSPIPETSTESIDISHIQPELEGVAIKATAVLPTFAAKVLSPQRSPPKLSPDVKPPGRDVTNIQRSISSGSSKEEKEKMTLEVVCQPENRRLTMHAGHTPNHSITRFAFLAEGSESGNATPTQEHHGQEQDQDLQQRRSSLAPDHENLELPPREESHESKQEYKPDHDHDHGDKELSGLLGFTNDPPKDDAFFTQLVEKLEEARKSTDASPSTGSTTSHQSQDRSLSPRNRLVGEERDGEDDDKDEGPPLRLKPSFNFGRPMGSM